MDEDKISRICCLTYDQSPQRYLDPTPNVSVLLSKVKSKSISPFQHTTISMALSRVHATVFLTLEKDFHDFNTLEILLEPTSNYENLEDYYDTPNEKFRHEILDNLRNIKMWKAGLNNPDGNPYKVKIGAITINTETDTLADINLNKTSHHSVKPSDLTVRD